MRLIVVDDESLIRMDLVDILEAAGHQVLAQGANGVEAIALAKEHQPDVILMDVKMPELDGIEAARQIARQRLAPVVLLTAYSQEDLVNKAKESGVYGYLIKPLREEALIPALTMAMGRFQEEERALDQIEALTHDLDEQKFIEEAKHIIREAYALTEAEAYERIRSYAMKKQMKIGQVAHQIVKASNHK